MSGISHVSVNDLETRLNDGSREVRFEALRELSRRAVAGEITRETTQEVNNHVHTVYSFSPYTPTAAAYAAWKAGLLAVGAMDHDSVAGCEEMSDAGSIIGIATTVGFEIRVNFSGTPLEGKKLNNPDSKNIGYIAIHGIPRSAVGRAADFLEPVQKARNKRNRRMVDALSSAVAGYGIESPTFDEVRSVSRSSEGGSITERHLMYALANRIIEKTGKGPELLSFLTDRFGLQVPSRVAAYLNDSQNPHYVYDLLGILKSAFLPGIYIQPDETECIDVQRVIDFAAEIGALSAYAYLGDVTDSPTGDKKAEQFEDSYLDELFPVLTEIGFRAVTYMPPRNTLDQLLRIQELCGRYGLMEISGVDINSSRQSFSCPEVLKPEFVHLQDAAWALIAHEKLSAADIRLGLFHPQNPLAAQSLEQRIGVYAQAGRAIDPYAPTETGAAEQIVHGRSEV